MCDPFWPQWTTGLYLGGVLTFFTYILPLAVISCCHIYLMNNNMYSTIYKVLFAGIILM